MTEELEARLAKLEQQQQLLQRTDPAISLGTSLHELGEVPTCSVTRSTTQTIQNATSSSIAFDIELWDTDGMHDNVTNNTRVYFNTAGIYYCEGFSTWSGASANNAIFIHKNGSIIEAHQVVGDYRSMNISCTRNFEIGEYIELNVYQVSGGALTTSVAAGYFSRLTATMVAAQPP